MKKFTHVSASQITTFHHPGGCNRKWYWNKVVGLPAPQHPSAALGEAVHGTVEAYLKETLDKPELLHAVARPAEQRLRLLRTKQQHLLVEAKMERRLRNDLIFVGRIDLLVFEPGEDPLVVDHKTSSSEEWALTEEQLKNDIQMNAYAYDAYCRKPAERIRVAHNFMRTKGGAYHRYTETAIPTPLVMENWKKLQDITDNMREVARIEDPAHVAENRRACDKYGGCPFKSNCQALWAARGERAASPYAALDNNHNNPTTLTLPAPENTRMPAATPATVLESMALDADVIKAAVAKGTAIDDTPTKKYTQGGAAPAPAPATTAHNGAAINPPEAGTDPRKVKEEVAKVTPVTHTYVDAKGNPTEPDFKGPQPNMDDAMKLCVQLGWSKQEVEEELSDAAILFVAGKNVKREDVAELVKGTGLVAGQSAEDVVIEVKVKSKARPSRGAAAPAAPAEPAKTETPAEQVLAAAKQDPLVTEHGMEVSVQPAKTTGTAPVRRPRNAEPRLKALGYPAEVVAGMDNAEMHRILDGEIKYVPNVQAAASAPPAKAEEPGPTKSEANTSFEVDPVIEELQARIAQLEGVLDIIVREAQGEDDASLAADYGGTGWEKHPAVEIARTMRRDLRLRNQDIAAPAGLTLYVDCAPEGGGTHHVELDTLLAPYCAKAAQEGYTDERTGKASGPLAYYDLMPYNLGQKKVIGYLLSDIAAVQKHTAVVVNTASPMAARALEVLRPLAAAVVVGRAR